MCSQSFHRRRNVKFFSPNVHFLAWVDQEEAHLGQIHRNEEHTGFSAKKEDKFRLGENVRVRLRVASDCNGPELVVLREEDVSEVVKGPDARVMIGSPHHKPDSCEAEA
jgi:hypothetical protein